MYPPLPFRTLVGRASGGGGCSAFACSCVALFFASLLNLHQLHIRLLSCSQPCQCWAITCLAGVDCFSSAATVPVWLLACANPLLQVRLCTCAPQAKCASALEGSAMMPAGDPMLDARIVWSVANPPRPDFCAADSGSLLPSSSTEAGFGQCRPMSVTQGEHTCSCRAPCLCMGAGSGLRRPVLITHCVSGCTG